MRGLGLGLGISTTIASTIQKTISFSTTPKIMIMGDSRQHYANNLTGQQVGDYGSLQSKHINGWGVAQSILSNFYGTQDSVWPKYTYHRYFDGANQGVSAKDTVWIRANLFSALSRLKPDACAIQMGINNGGIGSDPNVPTSGDLNAVDDIVAFVAACKANNVVPIIETCLPTVNGAKSPPWAINNILRSTYASDPTVILIDGANFMTGGLNNWMSISYMPDQLHFNYKGSQKYGEYIASVMSSYITAPNWLTSNSYTNLLPNSTFTGSGGQAGARVTGTIPNNWRIESSYAATCVVSIATDVTSGSPVMHLDITPVYDGTHVQDWIFIRANGYSGLTLGTAGTLTGKNYIHAAQFIIPSNDVDLYEVSPIIAIKPDSYPNQRQGSGGLFGLDNLGTEGGQRRHWICSSTVKADANCPGVDPSYRIMFRANGSGGPFRVSILMPRVYEVPDRETMWTR